MNAERWRRISAVFDQLCDAPAAERSTLLAQCCGDDGDLRREVSSLLEADAAGTALDEHLPRLRIAVAADWARDSEAPPPGATIGSWRIQRELGRGGMGLVMLAERSDGQFEQLVALKLIKRGMDSEAVLGRFLRERQILARLSHPNIARLLDGGLSSDGRPYFVMEYVEGAPLVEYCSSHSLGLRARVDCILQICAALQFAHRQLVVHLDIKPSNVLVTPSGEVKLLDFGIAKLLEGGPAAPMHTHTQAQRPFTVGYASPEQLLGEPVSTATDVYGIGCLLYELLTGQRPNGDAATPEEARLALTGREPLAPSKAAGVAPRCQAYRPADCAVISTPSYSRRSNVNRSGVIRLWKRLRKTCDAASTSTRSPPGVTPCFTARANLSFEIRSVWGWRRWPSSPCSARRCLHCHKPSALRPRHFALGQ